MKKDRLRVAGVIFILLGTLLPWRCYSSYSLGCEQLTFPASLGRIFSDPTWTVFFIVLTAMMFLLLNAAGLNLKQIFLSFASLFYCGLLSIKLPEYYQNGVYLLNSELLLILSSLTTWLVLYASFEKVRNAYRYLLVSSLALTLVSGAYIGETLYAQFINVTSDGQVKLAFGLPLILLGSLMVAVSRPIIEYSGDRAISHVRQ